MKYCSFVHVIFATVIISGCATPTSTTTSSSQSLPSIPPSIKEKKVVVWTKDKASQKEIAMVMEGVKNELRDPESARFQDIYALKGSNGVRGYCGYVNAKNGFGGYTGKTQFHFSDKNSIIMADNKVFSFLFPKICEQRTVTQ